MEFSLKYNLWKVFGLQRSGNHAILNWVNGLDVENSLFFNNVKVGKPLLEKSSGVSVPPGVRAYAERVGGKKIINKHYLNDFKSNGGRLVVSYENYDVSRFNSTELNSDIFNLFGEPVVQHNLVVLRNPFNMLVSAEKLVRQAALLQNRNEPWVRQVLNKRLELWKAYAFLTVCPETVNMGSFIPVVFDKWVVDKTYRNNLSESLGYVNKDLFKDFVSDAGNGSSFVGEELKNTTDVLHRWSKMTPLCKELISKDVEVFNFTLNIFGRDNIPSWND